MTLFEYLSVMTSIVLSLSAAQLLTELRAVIQPGRRYWVHTLWVLFALLIHLLVWWEFWAYRAVESWNFAIFTLLLLNPGILFVCSSALVRAESGRIDDWSKHFFGVRRTVFLAFSMLTIVSVVRRYVLTGVPILSPAHLPELGFALLFTTGFFLQNRMAHAGLVIAAWILLIIVTGLSWFEPGAVATPVP